MKKKCHLIFNQLRIDVIEFGHTHRRSLANIGIRVAATPPDPSRWRVEESVSSIDSTFISSCFKTTLLCFLGLLGHLQFLCHHLNLQSLKKKTKPPKKKVPTFPPLANPKFRKPQTCEVVPRDTLSSAPILCIPWSAPVAFQLWDEYLQTWFRQFWNCRKFGTNTVVREPPV